jgi:hypothetical protein
MNNMDAALDYLKQGLSILPLAKDKKPLIQWQEFQTRQPTELEVRQWFKQWPDCNIGIVTGKISNLTVIDCDSQTAIEYFHQGYQGRTPCVKTPKGMHFYFAYQEGVRNTARLTNSIDVRSEGGYVVAPPSMNGNGVAYRFINDLSFALDSFNNCFLSSVYIGDVRNSSYNSLQTLQYLTEGRRDEDLFHVANCLVKGGAEQQLVTQVLNIIAQNCEPPFPTKEVDAKIKSAIQRANRRERNLSQEIKEWISLQDSYFFLTDVYNSLHILTKEEKNNVGLIIHRLYKDEKVIEKHGDRRGCYRPVTHEYEVLDLLNAPEHEFKIDLPLGIHRHCRIYPKNVIVISGVANMGKSSMAFEICRLNRHLFPNKKVRFQTTEAGDTEVKRRLLMYPQDNFRHPLKWWIDNVEFIPRSEHWVDIIDADGFNIVDYISDYAEAYKIPLYIQQIHNKLKNGIAVLVIQKDPNKPHGQGGQATRHAARLAIDIERNRITLAKVKAPIRLSDYGYAHPDEAYINFTFENGWEFKPNGKWTFPNYEKCKGVIDEEEGPFIH